MSSAAASSGLAIMELASSNKELKDSYKWVGVGHCTEHCVFQKVQLVDKMKVLMGTPSSSFYAGSVELDNVKMWFPKLFVEVKVPCEFIDDTDSDCEAL